MVGRIGKVSAAIAIVAWCLFAIPLMVLCFPATFTVSAQESPLCPFIEYSAQYLLPVVGIFSLVFVLDILNYESKAPEREMRRQIELEKQKTQKPDDDEQRDWIMK